MKFRLAVTSLLVSATAFAAPNNEPSQPEPETTSYRRYTLTADAIGLGILVAGGLAEGTGGRDTTASETLMGLGLASTMLVTPAIHFARGHRERAVGSFLMRPGLMAGGMMLALAANSDCDDGSPPPEGQLFDDDFLCELDYIGYGAIGGLVAAVVIDAAFLTDERAETATWAPQITANRDRVAAGVTFVW